MDRIKGLLQKICKSPFMLYKKDNVKMKWLAAGKHIRELFIKLIE
jgi:hypothetical protein